MGNGGVVVAGNDEVLKRARWLLLLFLLPIFVWVWLGLKLYYPDLLKPELEAGPDPITCVYETPEKTGYYWCVFNPPIGTGEFYMQSGTCVEINGKRWCLAK